MLQGVYLTPYRADSRRSLRYYAPLVLLSSALVALAGLFVHFGRARRDPRAYWLAAALAGLVFAGAAEASRAWINYPYDWHQPRQAGVLLGFAVFGGGLVTYLVRRWPARPALNWLALGLAVLAALLSALLATGYDAKTALAFSAFALTGAVWTIALCFRGERSAAAFAPVCIALVVYASELPADLLDRGAYAIAAAFFGWAMLREASWLIPRPETPAPEPEIERLAIQTGGAAVFVPVCEIASLKAAGNYTEVRRESGETVLDNRGLTALLALLPGRFFRVHRSWAVDLARAERLTSSEGSRYRLILTNGDEIPVSREKTAALRERLGG